MTPDGFRWLWIARNDVREAGRDRTLLVLCVLFVLLGIAVGYLLSLASGFSNPGVAYGVLVLQLMGVFLPLLAVGISHDVVVGKRADGSLKLLLGLPFLRTDVVVGSYVGRAAITTAVTLLTLATAAIASILFGAGAPSGSVPLAVVGLTVVLGIVFTGIGIAVSCVTTTTTRAAMLGFLVAVLMVFLWGPMVQGLVWLVNGFRNFGAQPAWATFLQTLNPANAFKALASTQVPTFEGLSELVNGAAVYRTPAFAMAVLAAWALIVPLLAVLRFTRTDL